MSKTTYVICAINMIASAVALFLIFRSPTVKSRSEFQPARVEQAQSTEPPPSAAEVWKQFEQASDLQAAVNCLAKFPKNGETTERAVAYVRSNNAGTVEVLDFPLISRVGACVHFLGAQGQWGDPHVAVLQAIAKDRQACVVLRDLALRGVIDTAMRKHAIKDAGDGLWRAELADYLMQSDFGAETSMEGLALQAAVFVQNKGLATIDRGALAARLRAVLEHSSTVQEATLLSSLEVCAVTPDANLADAVRTIVKNPRSEAVLQMAISALGKIGSSEDRAWLAGLQLSSATLYRTTEAAWHSLSLTPPVSKGRQ